ncbi:MAG TPA: sodium:solute symporter [Burkholderiaceae bacterium]|jgi:SSS family transporter
MRRLFLLRALPRLCIAALLWAVLPAGAESLVSVRSGSLPAPGSAAPVDTLLTIGGHLLALGPDRAALLDADRKTWQPLPALKPDVSASVQDLVLRGDHVERLSLGEGPSVRSAELAQLPQPLSNALIATQSDALYLAGIGADGSARVFQRSLGDVPGITWKVIPAWPDGGRPVALVAQTSALFLAVADEGKPGRLLRWSGDKGWTSLGALPGPVLAHSARATGQAHLMFLIGNGGNGGGAAPRLMTFHTITGSWATLPASALPTDAKLSTAWKDGFAWLGADASQPLVSAQVEAGKQLLKWLDWVVIVVYLSAMLGMGLYFYLREKRNSTSDFFVGGRSIPFWAAGVSLYAANTSSISYIAIPAKAFETNWQYLTNNIVAVGGLMFVAVWIVPLLRRLDLMSVFSYLETRFHPSIRMMSSALCILVQLGSRMSVILFLPSLAINTITGLDMVWSILMMGGFTIAYTALGGMKAVVWTDVVQLAVKMGGALFAIGFIIWRLKGGFGEFADVATAANKTKLFDFSFDLTKATVWGFIFLVLFDVVLTFPKDQVLMQRTLSTKSDRDAGRSIWAFAAIMIPGGFVFYTIGTALFVFYKANPERMNPLLSIDATFPMFIAAELPMGVTGLIIAGIFAAAMATLSSIINSVATLASVDFYEKLVKQPDPKKSVLFAEVMTVAAGLIGVGFALLLSRFDIHSLFDVSIELAGLLGGGFAGAYTLGMFTRRANTQGVVIGVASSIALTTVAWMLHLVHPYFYLAVSILLCIVIGYLASLLFPPPKQSLKGLTIYADT